MSAVPGSTGRQDAGAIADPDLPGPAHGPRCPADRAYSDEATTGLSGVVARAWDSARTRAARAGVILCLNDGKRSTAQQIALFDQYVKELGSAALARRYVLPPARSAHVKGYAVDVQPQSGHRWLQATGGSLGFCRIYDNEPWHFEFSASYPVKGCPPRRTSAAAASADAGPG